MTQDSWVWVAWVSRAIEGSATFNDATAETTVARASMTTGSMARCVERRSWACEVVLIGASKELTGLGSRLAPAPAIFQA